MFKLSISLWLCFYAFIFFSHKTWAGTLVFTPLTKDNLSAQQIGPAYVAEIEKSNPDLLTVGVQNKAPKEKIEDAKYWHKIGMNQLKKIISSAEKLNELGYKRKAKNIIIFLGDGMGMSTITAGRIYKGQVLKHGTGEEETLSFDEFPYTGVAKTYNVDYQVPDSAGTATAIFCGSKTAMGAIGMDVTRSETNGTQGRLKSIMDWAQSEGKRTGIVTTTRITHATPASTYAHVFHRKWECDPRIPQESVGQYTDIARQLVENEPGNQFNVIFGGGLANMGALDPEDLPSALFADEVGEEEYCIRSDGRNLAKEWQESARYEGERAFVQTKEELNKIDLKKVDKVMGLFRNSHMAYSYERGENEPSLREMTEAAIKVLERGSDSNGYVLLVEGGKIDLAHHQNYAQAAMREVLELDSAIEAALNMTNEKETLILVTADHSHAFTLNGYPKRGTDVLGFANKSNAMLYETLSYANGPGYFDHHNNTNNTYRTWDRLSSLSTAEIMAPNYRHMATLPLVEDTHGGEDVVVFANGPGSSLVRGVFEQNYLAYVMSYAACMGPAKQLDRTCEKSK